MFGLSMGEILLLAGIALIVIGPKQLPEFARQLGKILNEIKRASGQFTEHIKQQAQAEVQKPEEPPPAILEEENLPEKKESQT